MDRNQIGQKVLAVLAGVLKCEVSLESDAENTSSWDSLKHIEIIFAVEDELGVQFSEDELSGLKNVSSIVDAALTRHET